jgi:hypothetical protein
LDFLNREVDTGDEGEVQAMTVRPAEPRGAEGSPRQALELAGRATVETAPTCTKVQRAAGIAAGFVTRGTEVTSEKMKGGVVHVHESHYRNGVTEGADIYFEPAGAVRVCC